MKRRNIMTAAEQIATANLHIAEMQLWVTAIAIFLGPTTGVLITFLMQSRKDKKAAKQRLFLTLMGERKSLPPPRFVTAALNTIDVVFADNRQVVDLWHKYYALLHQPPGEERQHIWLELLAAMAVDLRYPTLKQTDIDKFYIPQGHVDEVEFQREVGTEWLRVLKNTERFLVEKKTEESTDIAASISPSN
jgi:hypothetical protein